MEKIIIYIVEAILLAIVLLWFFFIRFIPNNKVGIVEKLWSISKGSLDDQIIALNGEAGYQPEVLRGGIHILFRLQYRIHVFPLVTIPQGQIAYAFARDGRPLKPAQALGQVVPEANTFQDVRAFLRHGGQRGPQREIIREGTYAFNLTQFVIITKGSIFSLPITKEETYKLQNMAVSLEERRGFEPVVIHGTDDQIGIVTVHDGASLEPGDIIAPTVGEDSDDPGSYHNNFQDPERFLAAGGLRGRQHQVIVEGTLHQSPLRYGGADPQDNHRCGFRGRGHLLHRSKGRRQVGDGLQTR